MNEQPLSALRIRNLDPVNWIGLWVLTGKETSRFIKVYAQTIVAPVISTLLYFIIFSIAVGSSQRMVGEIPYLSFLAPGLIMMSMAQNAFANTSSSIVISKVQGNIVDVLMPPLSPFELTVGYTSGGIARGVLVGAATLLVLVPFADIPIKHLWCIVCFGIMGSMMLALFGLIGGLWSEKFDHMAAVQNFIVMPATFLSGTFYSADHLPKVWKIVSHMNPFFYMIDGFRYGFVNVADGSVIIGIVVLVVTNVLLFWLSYWMFKTGYKLKS